jgi:hypothetical protein
MSATKKITSIKTLCDLDIKLRFNTEERWVSHICRKPVFWNSVELVFIDNYGETYKFHEWCDTNREPRTAGIKFPEKDCVIKSELLVDLLNSGGILLEPTSNKSTPLCDDIIDILVEISWSDNFKSLMETLVKKNQMLLGLKKVSDEIEKKKQERIEKTKQMLLKMKQFSDEIEKKLQEKKKKQEEKKIQEEKKLREEVFWWVEAEDSPSPSPSSSIPKIETPIEPPTLAAAVAALIRARRGKPQQQHRSRNAAIETQSSLPILADGMGAWN